MWPDIVAVYWLTLYVIFYVFLKSWSCCGAVVRWCVRKGYMMLIYHTREARKTITDTVPRRWRDRKAGLWLSCLVLFCGYPILFCLVLSCVALPCVVKCCLVLFVLTCLMLSWSWYCFDFYFRLCLFVFVVVVLSCLILWTSCLVFSRLGLACLVCLVLFCLAVLSCLVFLSFYLVLGFICVLWWM